jgi:aspartate aminotransferase
MDPKSGLSQRAVALQPSATLAMNAKAKKLKAEGKNVIGFAAGEPDFPTPKHIVEAAQKAAADPAMHKYAPNAGLPKLLEAVCMRFREDIGVEYAPKQVVVSPGAKYSLYLAFMAMVDPGDEVVLPAPYWVSYPEMVGLAGGKTLFLQTSEAKGFSFTAEDLEACITPRTKLLILNSPSNPTGGIVPPAEIEKIGRLLEKKGLWCVSDEIYDKLVYGGNKHRSVASVSAYCRDHTIVVNGVSKSYAMTGWRIGYAAGPDKVIKAMDDLQSQSTSNACAVAQAASLAALTGPQECVGEMVKEFAARRELIARRLNEIPGVQCAVPAGAFYALPNIAGVFGKTLGGVKVNTPTEFCNAALDQVLVAPVPGEAFGSAKHIRLSYATSREQIEEGCARLKRLAAS